MLAHMARFGLDSTESRLGVTGVLLFVVLIGGYFIKGLGMWGSHE